MCQRCTDTTDASDRVCGTAPLTASSEAWSSVKCVTLIFPACSSVVQFIQERSCPSRFCQELLLPLKEYDCQVLHCRHCGIINAKHRPKS